MDNDRLEIDEEEIPELFEELENSEWVDVDGKRVRANKDDHFINAMEYDFEPEQEEGLLTGDIDTQAESF
jgi:Cft2 family RNA processing exonuclease